jgi:hypothetical protein
VCSEEHAIPKPRALRGKRLLSLRKRRNDNKYTSTISTPKTSTTPLDRTALLRPHPYHDYRSLLVRPSAQSLLPLPSFLTMPAPSRCTNHPSPEVAAAAHLISSGRSLSPSSAILLLPSKHSSLCLRRPCASCPPCRSSAFVLFSAIDIYSEGVDIV